MPALYDHPATPVSSPHGRVLITPPPRSCQAARMVNFPPMRKNIRGEAMRARILAELRRRRDTWGPEPTQGVAVRGLLRHLGRHAAADGAIIRTGAYTRKRQPYRLEPEHVAAMIEAAPDALQRALLAVLYGGGLRLSEALALTLEQGRQLAARGQGIIMGKGKAERLCIIGRPAAADLAAYLEARKGTGRPRVVAAPYLWTNIGPGPWHRLSEYTARAMVKAAGLRVGLPGVLPHDFRHAFARHLYRGIGENIDAPGDVGLDLVRRMLGHANPETTLIYLDASAGADPDLRRAIAHHPGAR